MPKYSVNCHGEFYERVGKGEKDNIDFEIKGLKVEAKDEDSIRGLVRDTYALEHLRKNGHRKATGIRLIYIDKITKVGSKASEPEQPEVTELADMTIKQLKEFAADNGIDIDPSLTKRDDILQAIVDFEADGEEDADADGEETEEDNDGDGDGEELDDRGQPVK